MHTNYSNKQQSTRPSSEFNDDDYAVAAPSLVTVTLGGGAGESFGSPATTNATMVHLYQACSTPRIVINRKGDSMKTIALVNCSSLTRVYARVKNCFAKRKVLK